MRISPKIQAAAFDVAALKNQMKFVGRAAVK